MLYLKQKISRLRQSRVRDFKPNSGLSLLEVVVSLALLSTIIVVFSSALFSFKLANEAKNRNRAATLAEASLDALRALPSSLIVDQINGSFLGVLIGQGKWEVATSSVAVSAPNILKEVKSSSISKDVSGLLPLTPKNTATSTIEASIYWVPENSASGTAKIGFIINGRDLTHGYFYSIDPDSIQFEKLDNAITSLFSQSGSYGQSIWHKLKVVIYPGSFSLYYNNLLIGNVTDSTFIEGEIALFGEYALISADNISLSGDASASWNFDSDEIGALPSGLRRFGFDELPQGRGTLTIEDAYSGNSDLKKATARVYWTTPQGEKNVEASTLIAK